MRITIPSILVGLCLAGPAQAQVDQWAEQFAANQKLGYAHMQIGKQGDKYVKTHTVWTPVEGGLYSKVVKVETDANGRLLSKTVTETSPLGKSTKQAALEGNVLRWSAKERDLPARKGEVGEEVFDDDVLVHLHAIGKRPAGKSTVKTFDFEDGVEEETITATKEGDRVTVVVDDERYVLNAKGELIKGDITQAVMLFRPASEAEAKDMSRTLATPTQAPGLGAGTVTVDGVTLKHPGGKGWGLLVPAQGAKEKNRIGLIHPYKVGVVVLPIPVPLPEDEAQRLALGKQFMGNVNQDKTMQLSNPSAGTKWGLPGLRYDVARPFDHQKGEAWLLRKSANMAQLVMVLWPQDKQTETAALVAAARKAISFGPAKAAPAKKAGHGEFPCGLKLAIGPGWKKGATRRNQTTWNSPGGSQIGAWNQNSTLDPESAANAWAQATAPRFKATPPPATAVKVGSKAGFGCTMPVTAPNGVSLNLRLIVVPSDTPGQIVMLMVVAGPDLDSATIDKLLGSATWK